MAFRSTLAPVLCALLSQTGYAEQASQPQARIAYQASFYAQFNPSTALDMVRQTPGFTMVEGSERRGFAGATGNILIDGQRPVAKSQSLADMLQRIPAAQVVRIEVLRGGERGVDTFGQPIVANVVRTPSAGQGVYQLGTEYAGRAPVANGWASWNGRVGTTEYSLGANGYSLMRNLPGERERFDATGLRTATLEDRSPRAFYEFAVNAEASRPLLDGRMRVTGQVARSRYHQDASVATFELDGTRTAFEANPFTERKRTHEAGVDYDRPLGAWDLTFAGLATRTRYSSDVRSTSFGPSGRADSIFTQAIGRRSGETIARTTASRTLSSTQRIEASAELALNTLEQRLSALLDLGAGPFELPIPNSNLTVKERRAEAYVVHNWTPGSWSVETRLAGEISRLYFSGDTDQSTGLAYFKPSLQLTRQLGARSQLRFRIYRDIGQLDFLDFASSASVTDDRINGGNPDLRPETSWRVEATADLRFPADTAISLTLFRYWLSDAVDLVPVGPPEARFDAPGNIGNGWVAGAQANLRLPLKSLLPGALLTVDGMWRRSEVTDPLTSERRRKSDFDHRSFKAEFRHDLASRKIAWGATYTDKPPRLFYRLKEVERRRESPSFDLWIETTAVARLKTRLTIASLFGQAEKRERIFFAADRTGTVEWTERSRNHPGRWAILTVSGGF